MKCYNCGSEISDESKFCSNCGARIASADEVIIDLDNEPEEVEVTAKASEEYNADAPDTAENARTSDAKTTHMTEYEDAEENNAQTSEAFKGIYNDPVPEHKKKSKYKLWLMVLAAAIVFFGIHFGVSYFDDNNIVGQWRTENSRSVFGMFDETYIIFNDDGTADYYSGIFTHEKWIYKYNKLTGTLKTSEYGSMKGANTLHIKWLSQDEFMIVENGTTFVRSDTDESNYNDDDYDSSYETGESVFF